jgi:hypothetical protein
MLDILGVLVGEQPAVRLLRETGVRVEEVGQLLYHLVGGGEQRFQAECLGGFQVDGQLYPGRLLHR